MNFEIIEKSENGYSTYTVEHEFSCVSEIVYNLDLHKFITENKPFILVFTLKNKQVKMCMPQAITLLSTNKKFVDWASFH